MTEKEQRWNQPLEPKSLPKRFYKTVSIEQADDGFRLELDGKPVSTPGRKKLILPNQSLAERVQKEWESQEEHINPAVMPLTRLSNTAMEMDDAAVQAVRDDVAKFAGSDLICYRAEEPEELIMKQMAQWNPILDWANLALGVEFNSTMGITHVDQPPEAITQVRRAIQDFDRFSLTAIHTMTTLTGSILLVLAHISGRFDAVTCWQAAHVDEDWQISKWGWDEEAKERRELRWKEMEASATLFSLSNPSAHGAH